MVILISWKHRHFEPELLDSANCIEKPIHTDWLLHVAVGSVFVALVDVPFIC